MNSSILFFLALISLASAGTPNLPDEMGNRPYDRIYFTGALGTTPIQLNLRLAPEANHEREVTGHYFSTPGAAPVNLKGTLHGDKLTLTESTKAKAPATTIHGQFSLSATELTLLRTSLDQTQKQKIRLQRVTRQIKKASRIREIPFTSVNPFLIEATPLNKAVNTDLQRATDSHRADFAKLLAEILKGDSGKNLTWYGTWHAQLTHYSPELVSILVYHDTWVGGFHNNDGRLGMTYLQRNGRIRQLELANLFNPKAPWLKHISDYCARDLKHQDADHFQQGGRTSLEASELQKFTLAPDGLTIYFDPYEIGSYSEGAFAVTIPWKELRPLLADSAPLKALAAPTVKPTR